MLVATLVVSQYFQYVVEAIAQAPPIG